MLANKIKKFFNTIEYFPSTGIEIEELELRFINACCRCINESDIHFLIKKYKYLLDRITRADKIIKSNLKKDKNWLYLDISYNVDMLEEEKAEGVTIFTTVFSKKKNRVNYFSYNESGIYQVDKKRNIYYIYQNNEFYLQGKNNSMSIHSVASEEILLTLKMKDNYDLNLKNNNTKYSIVYRDGLYRVINKIVENLSENENLWALINTDILSKNSILTTTVVDCFEDDIEMMNYIGLAILLLNQNKMAEFNNRMGFMSYMMINRIRR